MRIYGSLQNRIMENSTLPVPVVGMAATKLMYSDRYPCTVIQIISSKKIVLQEDNAVRIDKNGCSESQTYEFSPNPDGRKYPATLRKNGRWIEQGQDMNGTGFMLGERSKYYDFSF